MSLALDSPETPSLILKALLQKPQEVRTEKEETIEDSGGKEKTGTSLLKEEKEVREEREEEEETSKKEKKERDSLDKEEKGSAMIKKRDFKEEREEMTSLKTMKEEEGLVLERIILKEEEILTILIHLIHLLENTKDLCLTRNSELK